MFGGTTNTAAAIDRTLDIEQHLGEAVLGTSGYSMVVEQMPAVGASPLPLQVAFDVPIQPPPQIAATFFDFALVPRPFPVGLPPMFCSPVPYYIGPASAFAAVIAFGDPLRVYVPFPPLLTPVTLVIQGAMLTPAGCAEVTEPLFLHVRP